MLSLYSELRRASITQDASERRKRSKKRIEVGRQMRREEREGKGGRK